MKSIHNSVRNKFCPRVTIFHNELDRKDAVRSSGRLRTADQCGAKLENHRGRSERVLANTSASVVSCSLTEVEIENTSNFNWVTTFLPSFHPLYPQPIEHVIRSSTTCQQSIHQWLFSQTVRAMLPVTHSTTTQIGALPLQRSSIFQHSPKALCIRL